MDDFDMEISCEEYYSDDLLEWERIWNEDPIEEEEEDLR